MPARSRDGLHVERLVEDHLDRRVDQLHDVRLTSEVIDCSGRRWSNLSRHATQREFQ